jgi:serine protease
MTGQDTSPIFQGTEAYLDQEILIGLTGAADAAVELDLAEAFGLERMERLESLSVGRFKVNSGLTVHEAADLVAQDARVSFAEPNYLARVAGNSGSDPYSAWQWNLDQVDAELAWEYSRGSGVIVAVLDTGVRSGGPDGIENLMPGYDFYYGDSDPTDNDGHGTFVAGTIGQRSGNGVGVAGLAPSAKILPVKVMSDGGYGSVSAISNGIIWATDQGASVINMSLGTTGSSETLRQACEYAYSRGVVLVAATGNEYASSLNYPAKYDTVIGVGASRVDGRRAPYSNTGSGVEILAPGGDLSKDQNDDGYADGVLQETIEGGQWTYTFWEGTSMAAPHVAATAALIIGSGVSDPEDVRAILADTASDLGSAGYDSYHGYGRLNAGAAVELAATGSWNGANDTGSGSGSAEEGSSDSGDDGPPVLSNVSGFVDGTSFTIQWATNEPATSQVEFEGYGLYGNEDLVTSHSLSFTGATGSTYTLTLYSTDSDGNTSTDGPYKISL